MFLMPLVMTLLKIEGLNTGTATDNIVVADADGVLKTVPQSSIGGSSPFNNVSDGSPADQSSTGDIYYTGGNLAIGVNSASAPLSVRGSGSTQAVIVGTGVEADMRLQSFDATGNATVNLKNGTNQMRMGLFNNKFRIDNVLGSSGLFTIDPSGEVGLGVNPTHKLDVDGQVRVRNIQASTDVTDEVVVAATDGVLKKKTLASLAPMAKVFYPMATPVAVAATGTGFTLDYIKSISMFMVLLL